MAVCGIYKITNKITQESYIGQSVDIFRRLGEHQNTVSNGIDWHNELHNHPDNFTFEVLETCDKELLNEKEVYYIEKYNSFHDGLNKTPGNVHATNKQNNSKLMLCGLTEDINSIFPFEKKVYKAINTTTFRNTVKKIFGTVPEEYSISELTHNFEEVTGIILVPYPKRNMMIFLPLFQGGITDLGITPGLKRTFARILWYELPYNAVPCYCFERTGKGYDCKYYLKVKTTGDPDEMKLKCCHFSS